MSDANIKVFESLCRDLFIYDKEIDEFEIFMNIFPFYLMYDEYLDGIKSSNDFEDEIISNYGESEYYKEILNNTYIQLLLTRLNFAPDADNSKDIKITINKHFPKMSSFLSMMEDITFNELAAVKENDEIEDIISVASFAYSLGMEIPFEMADRILKDSYEHRDRYKVEEEYQEHRKALKAAFISLGQEKLLKNGIDDVPIVFGPLKEGTLGVLTRNSYITISEAVLDIYLEKNNLLYLKMVIAMNI